MSCEYVNGTQLAQNNPMMGSVVTKIWDSYNQRISLPAEQLSVAKDGEGQIWIL
jgi:hypothetical protein